MMGLSLNIGYRADQRIGVVEVRTGNKAFLVNLETFAMETGVRDFDTSHTGILSIDSSVYSKIWKERVQRAEPHSFRFRKAKRGSEEGTEV